MAALYWRAPTAKELQGTGLKPKHYKEPHVDVLDEAWPAIDMFRRYSTQWIAGACGPIGLNYAVIFHEMDRLGIKGDEFEEMMAMLRIIEQSALEQIHKD